jgi:hypothetical protein
LLLCYIIQTITIFFVDDFIVIIPGNEGQVDWQRAANVVPRLSAALLLLGLPSAKWSIFTKGQFLGIGMDSSTLRVFLPPEKLEKCFFVLRAAAGSRSITCRAFAKVIGIVTWCAKITTCARPMIRTLNRTLAQRLQSANGDYTAPLRMSNAIKDRLLSIATLIKQFPNAQDRCTPDAVVAFSDASLKKEALLSSNGASLAGIGQSQHSHKL